MTGGARSVLVGDVGGSSVRVALIDEAGDVLSEAAADAPAADEGGGRSEIHPDAWWALFARLCEELGREEAAPVAAIALCGVTRTQVLIDAAGEVVRPAFTWNDARAGAEADAWRDALPLGAPERDALNAFHPLARLAWLRRFEPEAADRVATVLEPKDFISFRLTGRRASDAVSMARLHAGRRHLAVLGFPETLAPPLIEPTGIVARVKQGLLHSARSSLRRAGRVLL